MEFGVYTAPFICN